MSHIGFESIKTKVLDVDRNFSWARIMYFKEYLESVHLIPLRQTIIDPSGCYITEPLVRT